MTIVLDAMGSDQYPEPELQAAVEASDLLGEEIILVGKQELLTDKLRMLNPRQLPVRIHHAPDVLEMEDKVVESSRKKPQNSMAVGMELVKNGVASAFVTAGNTGAAMFNAIRILRRMQGILRPALITPIPTRAGRCVFMDTGANADCRPEFFAEFAIMGSAYAEKVLGVMNPRVGLLSNGEEEGKGNQLVKDTSPLLKSSGIHYIGNVEPKEVYAGQADVVVTDGFTGNVFIKTSEAVAKLITDVLREQISSSTTAKLGYLLAKPAFATLRKMMDPAEVGAALLIGVNGYVFIGHGRSDSHALVSALRLAHQATQSNLLKAIQSNIQERMTLLDSQSHLSEITPSGNKSNENY